MKSTHNYEKTHYDKPAMKKVHRKWYTAVSDLHTMIIILRHSNKLSSISIFLSVLQHAHCHYLHYQH